MEFFKIRRVIPFMRHALVFNVISLVTFLAAVFFLAHKGLHFSIEFTGGTLVEVNSTQAADVEKVRETLDKAGLKGEVQNFGSSRDVLIRLPVEKGQSNSELSAKVTALLAASRTRRRRCGASSSSARRSARNWHRMARWRCCWS